MDSVNILVEAKKQYTDELQKILTPRLYEGFKSIYEDIIDMLSRELEEKNTQGSSVMKTFQKMLKEIPQWNQDMIKNEYNRIEKLSNCDYFDNLIEAVFIANTKILTSVQINDSKSQNIKINVPQPSHFIHKCYIECAKEIYKNPYIFDNSKGLTPKEKHNNLRESISIIELSINNAIRNLLPIRDILKHGLTKNNEKIEEETNEEEEETNEEEEETNEVEEETNEEEQETNEVEEETNKPNEADANEVKNKDINETNNVENNKDVYMNDDDEESHIEINETENNKEKTIISEITEEVIEPVVILEQNVKESNEINLNEETKEIFYDKVPQNSIKSIQNIEKEEVVNEIKEPTIESVMAEMKNEKKVSTPLPMQIPSKNLFMKKINPSKFMKNKYGGSTDKNNSFYAKKYSENSANYHSISDGKSLQTTNLTRELTRDIRELTKEIKTDLTKEITREEFKVIEAPRIIKNKIVLNGVSSDLESDDELNL